MRVRSGARPPALAAALAAALFALSGCSPGNGPGSRPVTIEVWSGWTGDEGKAFQHLCDRFNAEQSEIVVHNVGGVTDSSKVLRAITAGVPPDLFTIWDAANVGPLAHYGAIRTLDAEFRAAGVDADSFVPGALRMCRYRGHLVGLPLLMDANALLWNKAAFREAGLDPERPPATLRELMAYARRLTKTDSQGRTVRLGLQIPAPTLLCWLHGGDFYDASGRRPTPATPENVRAYRYYADLVEAQGGTRRVEAFTSGFGAAQGPNHPFFVGKVAMMISGEWIPSWIQKYAPQLDYGVAQVPFDERRPDRRGTTMIAVNLLAIPTEAKRPREAWVFLRWLQRPDVQRQFAEALNNVPNVTSMARDMSLETGSTRTRNFGIFCRVAQHPNARGFEPHPLGQTYMDELGAAAEFVLYGAKSPGAALADVQKKMDRAYAELVSGSPEEADGARRSTPPL